MNGRYIPEDHDPLQLQTNHQHEPEEDSIQLKMKKPEGTTLSMMNHLESQKHIEETRKRVFKIA